MTANNKKIRNWVKRVFRRDQTQAPENPEAIPRNNPRPQAFRSTPYEAGAGPSASEVVTVGKYSKLIKQPGKEGARWPMNLTSNTPRAPGSARSGAILPTAGGSDSSRLRNSSRRQRLFSSLGSCFSSNQDTVPSFNENRTAQHLSKRNVTSTAAPSGAAKNPRISPHVVAKPSKPSHVLVKPKTPSHTAAKPKTPAHPAAKPSSPVAQKKVQTSAASVAPMLAENSPAHANPVEREFTPQKQSRTMSKKSVQPDIPQQNTAEPAQKLTAVVQKEAEVPATKDVTEVQKDGTAAPVAKVTENGLSELQKASPNRQRMLQFIGQMDFDLKNYRDQDTVLDALNAWKKKKTTIVEAFTEVIRVIGGCEYLINLFQNVVGDNYTIRKCPDDALKFDLVEKHTGITRASAVHVPEDERHKAGSSENDSPEKYAHITQR